MMTPPTMRASSLGRRAIDVLLGIHDFEDHG